MANEWIASEYGACYSGIANYPISQKQVLTLGKYFSVVFTISNMTGGKLILDSMLGKPEYTENGTYEAKGIATQENITFIPSNYGSDVFDGCITNIYALDVPTYSITEDGVVIYEGTLEGITSYYEYIQYQIDWTSINEGTYKIVFSDGILDYESYCLCLKSDTCKNLVLSWNNDSSAYGFNFIDLEFTPQVRVLGKLWKPSYPKEKDVFIDNSGQRKIISSRTSKQELLSIERLPQYLHDAISIGLEHDHFYINDVEYVNEGDEYTPAWVNSSNLAPVGIEVFKKRQNLINTRCGGTLE